MNDVIAGALYDFLGYLTSVPQSFKVGHDAPAYDIMTQFEKWARERGLAIEEPEIEGWQRHLTTAESLIDCTVRLGEFYSVPLEPVGDHSACAIGGAPGRGDNTNFAKRRKWMDAEEGAWSNDGRGSERGMAAPLVARGRTHSEAVARVSTTDNEGLDPPGKWCAVCDKHSTCVVTKSKSSAKRTDTEDFCDDCRAEKDENFGMAGLPGGVRDDPESPNSYDHVPQHRLR